MTKAFFHGRTEGIRTVSLESVRFAQTFCSDAKPGSKLDALRSACMAHTSLTRKCGQGLGQDRILYALYCLKKINTMSKSESALSQDADIFKDPGYGLLNHSVLSTSNCGNPALRLFGFGPVVDDGYGLGYIIKDDGLSIVGSSKHRQTRRFLDCLRSYLFEIQRLLKKEAGEPDEFPVIGMNREGAIKLKVSRAEDTKPVDEWKARWGGVVQTDADKDMEVLTAGYGFFVSFLFVNCDCLLAHGNEGHTVS